MISLFNYRDGQLLGVAAARTSPFCDILVSMLWINLPWYKFDGQRSQSGATQD